MLLKRNWKNKDAVETGYFATIGGGGQCGESYAVGSSPKGVPPSRVRLLLLIKYKEGVVNKSYFDQVTVAGLYATGGMNGLLLFTLLFKEIENKKGAVNECFFALNVQVAGSSPAIGLGHCSSVWLEQEHRKVHFTYCFSPFFKKVKY